MHRAGNSVFKKGKSGATNRNTLRIQTVLNPQHQHVRLARTAIRLSCTEASRRYPKGVQLKVKVQPKQLRHTKHKNACSCVMICYRKRGFLLTRHANIQALRYSNPPTFLLQLQYSRRLALSLKAFLHTKTQYQAAMQSPIVQPLRGSLALSLALILTAKKNEDATVS